MPTRSRFRNCATSCATSSGRPSRRRSRSCILFEGWDAAGKGDTIQKLVERLDPRGVKVHPISAPLPEEQLRPFLWRFWTKIPGRGEMAVFDRSWYGRVMVERVDRLIAPEGVAVRLQRDRPVRADAHRRRHGHREVLAAHQREGAEEALQGDREEQVRLLEGHQGGLGAPQAVRRVPRGGRGDAGAHQHRLRAVDHRRGDRPALPAHQGLQDHRRRRSRRRSHAKAEAAKPRRAARASISVQALKEHEDGPRHRGPDEAR